MTLDELILSALKWDAFFAGIPVHEVEIAILNARLNDMDARIERFKATVQPGWRR